MAQRVSRVAVAQQDTENESYEAPETPSHSVSKPARSSRVIGSGWGSRAPQEERRETVKAPYLKLKDNGHRIIKIMDEVPPVRYDQHYVNSSKRSYTCGTVRDDDGRIIERCPLCDAGHRSSVRYMLNVVDMADPNTVVKWDFGTEVSNVLQEYISEDNPLNGINRYFEVYHISVAGRSAPSTKIERLKARDLEEDHGILPLTQSEIDDLTGPDGENLYGEEVVWVSTTRQLQEVADGLSPNDLPKNRR